MDPPPLALDFGPWGVGTPPPALDFGLWGVGTPPLKAGSVFTRVITGHGNTGFFTGNTEGAFFLPGNWLSPPPGKTSKSNGNLPFYR